MKKTLLVLVLWKLCTSASFSQQTFPQNGAFDERPGLFAFTNATIIVDPKTTLQKATLLIKNGLVSEVGVNVSIPRGTVITDLKGKFIYPSFIDLDSDYGMPETRGGIRASGGRAPQQMESDKKGAFGWNQAVQPETRSSALFAYNKSSAEELLKIGFGVVLTHLHDGIVRGSGSLVSLADEKPNKTLLKPDLSGHYSFSKGTSTQSYPTSPMGAVALLRQTFYDADWYAKGGNTRETNLSLASLNEIRSMPSIFESGDQWAILRADKVGDEFGIQFIIKGSGHEYQRIEEIKATAASLIIPLNFPETYDVTDSWDADAVSLSELKHWEMAPANAAMLSKAGLTFSITTAGLKNKSDFWTRLKTAVDYGLPKEQALQALTTTPARLIKAEQWVGRLKKGLLANFLIASGDLFEKESLIHENWVQGKPFMVTQKNPVDFRGIYNLQITGQNAGTLKITGSPSKPEFAIQSDTTKIIPKVTLFNELITLHYQPDKQNSGTVRLNGWTNGRNLEGDGQLSDGTSVTWKALFVAESEAPSLRKDTLDQKSKTLGALLFPMKAYGWDKKPRPETLLFKNATVWTNEKEGILENTDVLVQQGKILKVGKNLTAASARTIDATGKHLTSGIIDEHSHIALFGINEGSQSSSAEVRMADVINPDDIDIYRQLAGGVTTSQLLHGSANAIGGQSAVVKLKWGATASEMLLPEAKYIKFALGENVKQSNWGDAARVRFPQTRMGVEQVYFDHFIRAREYNKAWKDYRALQSKTGVVPPRRDLELDALAEILNEERFITCHSYVQSEINMLMKVADSLKFKVNTFTHILEGYKLADKMAERGIGGSTFADWWAYKMEVKEAIPYNAALMAGAGVVVAINSDDAEMARRLNQEAAKTLNFGGVSEEDAWKMVTLNPAKLLHLDQKLGSIKAGKDGDVVLWSHNPLSIYARPEYTIIEGTIYFDLQAESEKRKEIIKEKARLIQKSIESKSGGAATQSPQGRQPRMWHCEDVTGLQMEGHTDEHELGK